MTAKTIQFAANPKQKAALRYLVDHKTRSIGYGGGAGGGKSMLGCFWVYSMADTYPGTRWFIGRNELTRLKKSTWQSMLQMFKIYDIPKNINENWQENIITLPNESQIFLLDLAYKPSDPLYERFGSMEFTSGFVDEAGEVDEKCIEILSTRIGRCKNNEYGIFPKILETFNPNKGHVYHRYYTPHKNQTMPDDRVFIPALATDEAEVSDVSRREQAQMYIDNLKRASESTRQRLLYGNFEYDDDPDILFPHEHVTEAFSRDVRDISVKYMTVDVARKGADSTVIGIWDGFQLTHVYKYGITLTNEVVELIHKFCAEHSVPERHVIIDESGVGGGVVDNIQGCIGFVSNARPIETKPGSPENYENLKAQCVYKLADMFKRGMIGISSADGFNSPAKYRTEITEELGQYKQRDADKDGKLKITKKEDIKQAIGRSPDFADMMLMRMCSDLKHRVAVNLPTYEIDPSELEY